MKGDKKGISLLSKWKESDKKKSLTITIPKAPLNAKIPASHGQQRLWFFTTTLSKKSGIITILIFIHLKAIYSRKC